MASGEEVQYVSDNDESDQQSLIDDISEGYSLPHMYPGMNSPWYGSYPPPPSPYCDTVYRAHFYGFGPPAVPEGGPSSAQSPPQTPVEVDVSPLPNLVQKLMMFNKQK